MIHELCQLAQVYKLRTTPYHPETNTQCECFNSTLIYMIGTLSERDKSHWRDFVLTLVHAYNCTKSSTMDLSLYCLMYGRKLRLPLDLYFGAQPANLCETSYTKFIQHMKERLQWAYEIAQKVQFQEMKQCKLQDDQRVKCFELVEPGDLVLLCECAFHGKHKIKDHWDHIVYETVVRYYGHAPMYKIKPHDMKGNTKALC